MSLNVNGLGNAIKRARVMTKIKKENKHVIFLQETHLSPQEHEKLKNLDMRKYATVLMFIVTKEV